MIGLLQVEGMLVMLVLVKSLVMLVMKGLMMGDEVVMVDNCVALQQIEVDHMTVKM